MPQTSQFCTFYVDDLFFGIELRRVQEVLRYVGMTPVPLAPFGREITHVLYPAT
jgi:purine-binding chemotaxis protein CheW